MQDDDLERVRADLAVVKGYCVEPAVPREEVGWYLATAAVGVALAVTPWLMPIAWVKLGMTLAAAICLAVYLPRKMRLLKLKQPLPERAMEVKEFWVWGVAGVALVSYVLYCRFMVPGGAAFDKQLLLRDAGAMFIFLGIGFVGNAMVHRTRRPLLAIAVCLMAAGVLIPFTTSVAAMFAVLGGTLALGCLGTAAGFEYLARRQRREYGGN